MILLFHRYQRKNWVKLKQKMKDAFRHADSQLSQYTESYFEPQCTNQLECGNAGLKAFIVANTNISRTMINKSELPKYSQVEMLLGALPTDM
jgi:hypothetical protein